MKSFILFLISALLIWSCDHTKEPEYRAENENIYNDTIHPGKKLIESNCYVCHSPTATEDNRLAPPMIAIKKHYINENTSKEEFINNVQDWIYNPTEENARMFGAVRRFGVMPKAPFPKETIEQIADYIFDNEIEQPEWFEDHFNSRGRSQRGKRMRKRKGSL
jgi:mono/diheme cytochrome c family protein